MRRRRMLLPLLLFAVVPLVVGATSTRTMHGRTTVPFADARLIVEVNATDGDAGLQVFVDGEPWKAITIRRPDGRHMVDVKTRSERRDYGPTELFSESSEPSFDEFPLEQFKLCGPREISLRGSNDRG